MELTSSFRPHCLGPVNSSRDHGTTIVEPATVSCTGDRYVSLLTSLRCLLVNSPGEPAKGAQAYPRERLATHALPLNWSSLQA